MDITQWYELFLRCQIQRKKNCCGKVTTNHVFLQGLRLGFKVGGDFFIILLHIPDRYYKQSSVSISGRGLQSKTLSEEGKFMIEP